MNGVIPDIRTLPTRRKEQLSTFDSCIKLKEVTDKETLLSRTRKNDGFKDARSPKVKCQRHEFTYKVKTQNERCNGAKEDRENVSVETEPVYEHEGQFRQKSEKLAQITEKNGKDEYGEKESEELDEAEEKELLSVLDYDIEVMHSILRNMGFFVNLNRIYFPHA
uniref:Uncharacterized protein n=1 Tax=Angiostrongylus cantonensis TaxID=6313 RepID=A0A0K0D004_ANGCA